MDHGILLKSGSWWIMKKLIILKYKDWIMADHENVPDHDHGSWLWTMVQIISFRS